MSSKAEASAYEVTATPSPWKTAIICGMASYLDAGALTGMGTALVLYLKDLNLSQDQVGVMSGLLTLFFAGGSLVGGHLGDKFGRRTIFRFSILMFLVGCALVAGAQNAAMLYAGVVFTGFAIGADMPVSLALAAESSPAHLRGRAVTIASLLWLIGIVSTAVLTSLFSHYGSLCARIIFAHLFIVGVFVLLARQSIPESKEWLAANRLRPETADQVQLSSIGMIFSKKLLPTVAALTVFLLLWNIPANTSGQFGAMIWNQVLDQSLESYANFQLMLILPTSLFFLLFMKIVDSPKRQLWVVIGAMAYIAAFILPVAQGLSLNILIASILLQIFGAMMAGENLFRVLVNERMPVLVRSTSQGLSMALARLGAASFAVITPSLLTNGATNLYQILLACALGCAVILCLIIPRLTKADI